MNKFLYCCAIFLFSSVCSAQTLLQVQGTITDQTNAALPNVIIKAVNIASGKEAMATTEGKGHYTIKGLLPGNYRLTASAPGFDTLIHYRIRWRR